MRGRGYSTFVLELQQRNRYVSFSTRRRTASDILQGVRLATHLTHFPASRFIIPMHIHHNHWIVAHIDIDNEYLSIYDSWPATYERNNAIKDNKKTEHWPYIMVRMLPCLRRFSITFHSPLTS